MSDLFNRAVQVSVGEKNGDGIQIRGLRVTFNIEKSLEEQPNNSRIQIYNLSERSRAIIEDRKTAIILEAGYGQWVGDGNTNTERFNGNLKKIFVGDVARVRTEKNGPDIVTSIEAGDGEVSYNNSKMNASYAPGTRAGQVLDGIISSFELTKGMVSGFNVNDQFQQGLSLSGLTRDHMSNLANRQGLEWSIQDNQLQILRPGDGTTQEAVLLNPFTGLIGSPFKDKIVNQDLLTKKDGKEATSGTEAVSLLNADIRPGRYVRIESQFVNGNFKVVKVTHEGDTHSTTWYTRLEAK